MNFLDEAALTCTCGTCNTCKCRQAYRRRVGYNPRLKKLHPPPPPLRDVPISQWSTHRLEKIRSEMRGILYPKRRRPQTRLLS